MSGKVLISTMKNEGPFILEWVAYHRAIGFDGFVIASNDCEDKSDDLLDALAFEGIISHRRNPVTADQDPQYIFLNNVLDHPLLRDADWIMALDVDEFLNINLGRGHVDDLLSLREDADAFVLLWKNFGDSGHRNWQDGLIIEKFTACESNITDWNRYHKTIFRNNEKFYEIDAHYPVADLRTELDDLRVYNSEGVRYDPAHFKKEPPHIRSLQSDTGLWTWKNACVNHHPFKTPDLFAMKRHRGDVVPGRGDKKYVAGSAYHWLGKKNDAVDLSLHRLLPEVHRQLELMRASRIIRRAEEDMRQAFEALRTRVLATHGPIPNS